MRLCASCLISMWIHRGVSEPIILIVHHHVWWVVNRTLAVDPNVVQWFYLCAHRLLLINRHRISHLYCSSLPHWSFPRCVLFFNHDFWWTRSESPLGCPQVNFCADNELIMIHMNEMHTYIGLIGAIPSFPFIFTFNEWEKGDVMKCKNKIFETAVPSVSRMWVDRA